ncbi:Thiosulfate sulfurtransferase PspE precursor [uncultured Clostridium sp.]|uniref:Rhodanese-like domain-containing protein n=1 Tax=Paeniclostridium hominis TaxID=2764329 RepID=A0ABR7K1E1_9FIRM|nr:MULTISPECIES: rhodanese-like domain-containing protein [Paeniclostridium]MBC6002902.1 rhodanese-like domain-containing protein [Paeniclostridium hominis]MDU1538373.1 rhodanese-like domain-containing protein [Paeniclostridium sordellii]SCI88605.1 Thiosulfate sulfurtransferase PspE precursor [uncultured Clostridium sp.]SCJ01305.1 Thiosulfate sulfurtransferase PspE precursor [uncultured Clostridium sp.]
MNYINIDNEKLKEMINEKDTLLIDIRTKEEFDEKNIDGAINIPLQNLMQDIDEIIDYKDKSVIIYCRSGHRSIIACNLLEMEGFKHIYNLEKGIIEYK